MPRIALINMIFGFWLIFLASAGGFFLSQYQLEAHLSSDPKELLSWWNELQKSAHGHTNLFGMLHILFALSFPYSHLSTQLKVLQSSFVAMGSLSMSILLFLRAYHLPQGSYDALGLLIGLGLSLTLVAVIMQIIGLTLKLYRASP